MYSEIFGNELKGAHNSRKATQAQVEIILMESARKFLNKSNMFILRPVFEVVEGKDLKKQMQNILAQFYLDGQTWEHRVDHTIIKTIYWSGWWWNSWSN